MGLFSKANNLGLESVVANRMAEEGKWLKLRLESDESNALIDGARLLERKKELGLALSSEERSTVRTAVRALRELDDAEITNIPAYPNIPEDMYAGPIVPPCLEVANMGSKGRTPGDYAVHRSNDEDV